MGMVMEPRVQLRYLKVPNTDFIFSAMAEELVCRHGFGYQPVCFVIYRCFRVARKQMICSVPDRLWFRFFVVLPDGSKYRVT
jgi:cell division protein FtsW (lipid II flippase)